MQKYITCYNCGEIIKYGDPINVVPFDWRAFCCIECLADSYGGREVSPEDDADYDELFDLGKQKEGGLVTEELQKINEARLLERIHKQLQNVVIFGDTHDMSVCPLDIMLGFVEIANACSALSKRIIEYRKDLCVEVDHGQTEIAESACLKGKTDVENNGCPPDRGSTNIIKMR